MTDTPPVVPVTPSVVDMLGSWAKALPVLVVLVVCYSIEFEIVYMVPHGVEMLEYYSWLDYARLGVVWFPVVIVALFVLTGMLLLFAALIRLLSLNSRAHQNLNVLAGETPTPKVGFWRNVFSFPKPLWRSIAFLIGFGLLGAAILWVPHVANLFSVSACALAMMVVLLGPTKILRLSKLALPDLRGRDMGLAAALFFAAIVGGLAEFSTYYDAKYPEFAKITVKSDLVTASVADRCYVIRALATTLLVSCKGKVIAINNSIVEMVEYSPTMEPPP